MATGWVVAGQVFGGLGIFLLSLSLLTQGLQMASRPFLQTVLARFTGTPLRGLLFGVVVTALLQSSSAVTVILLGLVNAAALPLSRAIYIFFGSNIGTTMTGWLVSLTGMDFDIKAAALPFIGLGMALKIFSSRPAFIAAGLALTGFGLFFVGVDILKEAFSGYVQQAEDFTTLSRDSLGLISLLTLGFVLTVLTMSSSASTAIILTSAAGGLLTLDGAAAMVIGANLGTSVKAIIAAFGASPNTKRAAVAHVTFNLVTAIVALLILQQMLALIRWGGLFFEIELSLIVTLALFHTLFNLLGCAIMLPFVPALTRQLEKLFRIEAEDLAQPHFIDRTALSMPALALDALHQELQRLKMLACIEASALLDKKSLDGLAARKTRLRGLRSLSDSITTYCGELAQEQSSEAIAGGLQAAFRVNRYLQEVLHLAPHGEQLRQAINRLNPHSDLTSALFFYTDKCQRVFDQISHKEPLPKTALRGLSRRYRHLKDMILAAGAEQKISTTELSLLLDQLRHLRRAVEQAVKAERWLGHISTKPSASPELREEGILIS